MDKDERSALIRKAAYAARLHKYHIITTFQGYKVYRGQPPFLKYLSEHANCSQKDLAQAFRISPASVAVSIKRLCRSGLAEKVADASDARVNRLNITARGRGILDACEADFEKIDIKMFEGISDGELDVFSTVLDKMVKNLGGDSLDESEIREILDKERAGDRH